MDYRSSCSIALEICESKFRMIEAATPRPQWVPWDGKHNWRYVEKLPSQMILQKLARQITGLKSLDILLQAGFLQEVGVIFRMLDEIGEDIQFIALGLSTENWTENHKKYADFFWSEANDDRQPPVRRKNIRAYVNRAFGSQDPSTADSVGQRIHKAFSDYIHARSAPIMGMVWGPPARYQLEGIRDNDARWPYISQAPSYYYRAALSTAFASKVTLPEKINDSVYAEVCKFENEHSSLIFPISQGR
jgi:hypothetical protein